MLLRVSETTTGSLAPLLAMKNEGGGELLAVATHSAATHLPACVARSGLPTCPPAATNPLAALLPLTKAFLSPCCVLLVILSLHTPTPLQAVAMRGCSRARAGPAAAAQTRRLAAQQQQEAQPPPRHHTKAASRATGGMMVTAVAVVVKSSQRTGRMRGVQHGGVGTASNCMTGWTAGGW